jgi:hypothetical protein
MDSVDRQIGEFLFCPADQMFGNLIDAAEQSERSIARLRTPIRPSGRSYAMMVGTLPSQFLAPLLSFGQAGFRRRLVVVVFGASDSNVLMLWAWTWLPAGISSFAAPIGYPYLITGSLSSGPRGRSCAPGMSVNAISFCPATSTTSPFERGSIATATESFGCIFSTLFACMVSP